MLKPDECFHEHYQISYIAAEQPECSVYRAYDQHSARPVLIAELPQEDEEALAATRLLAQEVAALYEASLLGIREHFAAEQAYYMVVDDPGGHDLERTLQHEAASPPEQQQRAGLAMLDQAGRLLNALEALHNHKPPLLVGELHPGDVWSSAEGTLYLAPFALLRPVQAGMVAYRAPELETEPAGEATPASDLYALGAVCYHLLTGWPPPTAALRLAGTPLNAPRSLRADIPPLLDRVIIRALDVQPANRYQTVYEMRHALALAHLPVPPAAPDESRQPVAHAPAAADASEPPVPLHPGRVQPPQAQPAPASTTSVQEQDNNACLLIALLVLAVLALSICAVGIFFLLGPGRTLLNLDGLPLRGTRIALQCLLVGG